MSRVNQFLEGHAQKEGWSLPTKKRKNRTKKLISLKRKKKDKNK